MKVTLITARIEFVTAGGVTGPEAARRALRPDGTEPPQNVLELRRDPDGVPHLPGTTVAGSLRAHCADVAELPTDLFGGPPGLRDAHRNAAKASAVQVLGTVCGPATDADTTTRTAIDRTRGSARTNTLHTVERLRPGTTFDIFLRWDDAPADQLAAFLTALRAWRPRLGRGVSTGAGRCRLVGLAERTFDLTTVAGLRDWLDVGEVETYPAPEAIDQPAVPADALPELPKVLRIVDGLHIDPGGPPEKGPADQDVAPVVRDPRTQRPVVPGSSLKGILRSRAEYLCRVSGVPVCLNEPCGQCRPCRIFGHGGVDGAGVRGRIAVLDAEITDADVQLRQHAAIDRFTGGAPDKLLFTDQVVVAGTFPLRVERLAPLDPADLALLCAVVADLDDGLVGIGGRTTRGYGTVRVADPEWVRPDLTALHHLLSEAVVDA